MLYNHAIFEVYSAWTITKLKSLKQTCKKKKIVLKQQNVLTDEYFFTIHFWNLVIANSFYLITL